MSKKFCDYEGLYYFLLFWIAFLMTIVGINCRILYEKLTRKKEEPPEIEVRTQELIQLRERKVSLIASNPEEKDAIELLFEMERRAIIERPPKQEEPKKRQLDY